MFCYRFAIETILFLKQNEAVKEISPSKAKRRFQVVEKCDIIVWPRDNSEIIREAEVGEILSGKADYYDKPNFFAVLQDYDDAFVEKNAVVPLVSENENDPD